MVEEFVAIFTQMTDLALIFFVAGSVLLLLELIFPVMGVFILTGIASYIGGVVTRAVQGASFYQIVLMLVLCGLVSVFVCWIYVKILDKGANKTALVQNNVAVSGVYENPHKEFGFLIGKTGVITAECRPFGRAEIENSHYEVVSDDGKFIIRGTDVVVTDVDFDHIFVKKIK